MNLSYIKANTNYELATHTSDMLSTGLGNVLAIVSDRLFSTESSATSGLVDFYSADIVSSSDYYPGVYTERSRSGMLMPGRSFSSNQYRYGFNGQEKDDEMKGSGNSYEFGARIYDSRLGRWLAVDPLAAKYPDLSPYCYAGNSPVVFIDPDGEKIRWFASRGVLKYRRALLKTETGKKIWKGLREAKSRYRIIVTDDVLVDGDELIGGEYEDNGFKIVQSRKNGRIFGEKKAKKPIILVSLGTYHLLNNIREKYGDDIDNMSDKERNKLINKELKQSKLDVVTLDPLHFSNGLKFWTLKRVDKSTLNIKEYSGEKKKDYEKARKVKGMSEGFFLNTKGTHEGIHGKQGITTRNFSESEAVEYENKSAEEYENK